MKKPKTTTENQEKDALGYKTFLHMSEALNEIRLDFELPDEHLDREDKARVLKEIRDDLIKLYWNYELVKRNKYDNSDQN